MARTILLRALSGAALAVTLLAAGPASAYQLIGPKWQRADVPVDYRINPNGAPREFTEVVRTAASVWSSDNRFDFSFRHVGSSDVAHATYTDRTHVVYWNRSGAGMDPTTLATTFHWNRGNAMIAFDMVFNGSVPWSLNPNSRQYDLRSVALHEFGHALGLAHSDKYSAVMYYKTPLGTRRRSLTTDDVAGAATLYPTSASGPLPGRPDLLAPGRSTGDTRPSFRWSSASNAAHYLLIVEQQLSGSQTRTVLRIDNIRSTSYRSPSSFQLGASFAWRVLAVSSTGRMTSSVMGYFVTEAATSRPPANPILLAPSRYIRDGRPTFSWEPVPGATSYELWVNQVGGRSKIVHRTVRGNSYRPPSDLPAGSSYHWWVRAINSQGASDWSARSFYIYK